MKFLLALSILSLNLFAAPKYENAFQVCADLGKKHLEKCIEVVKSSTRPFPATVLKYCENVKQPENVLEVFKSAVDSVFPKGALEACEKFADDNSIETLVACMKATRKVEPLMKKVTSGDVNWTFINYRSWDQLYKAQTNQVEKSCGGWQHFYIYPRSDQDPANGKTVCKGTSHTENYEDYTLGTFSVKTNRNTYSGLPTIVPVQRTMQYTLYHCNTVFYCYSQVKDFSWLEKL